MPPPPTFSMVHLLHRLYGVDAPVFSSDQVEDYELRTVCLCVYVLICEHDSWKSCERIFVRSSGSITHWTGNSIVIS